MSGSRLVVCVERQQGDKIIQRNQQMNRVTLQCCHLYEKEVASRGLWCGTTSCLTLHSTFSNHPTSVLQCPENSRWWLLDWIWNNHQIFSVIGGYQVAMKTSQEEEGRMYFRKCLQEWLLHLEMVVLVSSYSKGAYYVDRDPPHLDAKKIWQ